MLGAGFTTTLMYPVVPVQLFNDGVTPITPISIPEVLLVVVNAGMFPDPLAGNPIPGAVLVQLKVAPAGVEVKL